MKKTYIGIVLMVVLAMMLAACNAPQAPTQANTTGEQTLATPNQQNQATPLPQATNTAEPVTIPQILNLQSSLDTTDSYRITLKMHLVGKNENNEDADEQIEMNQEIIRSQNASRLTWKNNQSTDSPEFTIINLDGNSYMENMMGSGESGCFSFPADQAASQMDSLGTANFVGNISPESLVARGENVNGILTDHYTIKEAQLFGLGVEVTSAKGDVWVTPDGKYTIKYIYEAEGKFAQMSTGATITGTFTMSYDLTDINQVAEVTVPQSCLDQQQQMADVPMMADAGQVSNLSGMITYITASEANVVKEFYMTQAAGWTVSDDSSMEGFVSFKITKGDKVYNVMVTANAGGGSMVILTLEQ